MFAASKTASVSAAAPDGQFNYVTMLLHGDGTNGAQNNTFLDSSTNAFSITRNGNTTQGSLSPYGSNWSNFFDGTSDYLSIANNAALNMGTGDFTVEAWINISNIDFRCIICLGQYNNGAGVLRITNSGNLQWYWNDASFIVTSSTTVTVGVWSHVAVVRSSGTTKLYINGTNSGSGSDSNSYSSTYPTWVGSENQGSVESPFHGNISNVRVVKGTAVYTSNFTPPTSALTAISGTSLLTCQANRFLDASSNAFAVTRNGDTSVQRFNPFGTSTAYSTSVIGGSAYFDGSGDNITTSGTGSFNPRSTFTVEFWTYPITNSTVTWINSNTDNYFYIETNAGTLYVGDGSLNTISTTPPPLNQWTHLMLSFDGTTYRLFYNGVSQATSTNLLASNTITVFKVGQKNDGNRSFNGYITDMRVLVGTALQTSTFTPPTAPLTAITNTTVLLKFQNAAIFDNAMMNDLETEGVTQISTSVVKFGTGSISFNGSRLVVPSAPTLIFNGNFTMECWFYPTTLTGNDGIFASSGQRFGLIRVGDSIYWLGSPDVAGSSGTLTVNTWHHIAVSRSGSTLRLFVNGVLGGSGTTTQVNSSNIWYVGSNQGNENLEGYIDDLRITNGYARYTATFTAPTSALSDTGPY